MLIRRRHGSREADRIQQDMVEIFRSLVIGVRPVSRSRVGAWRPPVEVYESERELVITIELAGVREEEMSVVVDDSIVRVTGVRGHPYTDQKRTYHEVGIAYGPFEAEVFLPFPVLLDDVEAVYENGFLRISLSRAQATHLLPEGTAELADE
jgi:HSP20 family protein